MLLSTPVQQRSIEAIPVFLSPHQEAEAWLCKWSSAPRPACLSPKPSACCSWLPMQVPASLSLISQQSSKRHGLEPAMLNNDAWLILFVSDLFHWIWFFHFVCKIFVNKSAQEKQGCVQKQLAWARNLLSILRAMLNQGRWRKSLIENFNMQRLNITLTLTGN